MNVAIIIGSNRAGRQSHKIAYYLEDELKARCITTDIIDLAEDKGAAFDIGHTSLWSKEAITLMAHRVQKADGLMLVTPEYHGSFSGVLKMAMDHLETELRRKPVGVVAVSSGCMGGIAGACQLQQVVLSLGGYVLPCKLLVPDVQSAFDDSFRLLNDRTARASKRFIDEFTWFATAIAEKKFNDHSKYLLNP